MDFPHLKFKSYQEAVVNDVLLYAMSTCGYTLEEQIVALVNDRQRLVSEIGLLRTAAPATPRNATPKG